ncbi:MAG: hypothetical protein LBQ39_04160 [Tannerellaceae bacterium]|jgi:hypothetical protein|nr:hypothetical protein [Tannerellaceae bacterium]
MKKESNNLVHMKGKNPFTVPDGYMEGLTSRIMTRLPEKTHQEAVKVTFMDRVRPWIYMAAVFAGLGLFFKIFLATDDQGGDVKTDSLFVQTMISSDTFSSMQAGENEEYLEYLESQYTDYILAEELAYYE